MITRIEAHGYHCPPKLAVDLIRYRVLSGVNGAGKTTLLDTSVVLDGMLARAGVVAVFLERQGSGRSSCPGTLTDLFCNEPNSKPGS